MKATLKKRFVLFAMFAVTVLLVVLIGTINIISWTVLEKQSDDLLQAIVMRGEKPHFLDNPQMEPPAEDSFPERPGRGPFQPPMNQDTLNSARFFVVITDLEGQVLSMNLDEIASVDKEQAEEYAAKATGESGEIGSFKYEAKTTGEERILFFMDTSGQKQTFLMILSISWLIALMCWGLVLLFVMALSGRVVQPIVAAMEKQKQFITNAGHELKTPLAIIQSNNDASELIYGETKYSTNIRQQTRRLNGLMSNLLTLARLSEQTSLQKEHVNLSSLLEKMAADYELPARDKNLTLHLDVRKDVCLDGQERPLPCCCPSFWTMPSNTPRKAASSASAFRNRTEKSFCLKKTPAVKARKIPNASLNAFTAAMLPEPRAIRLQAMALACRQPETSLKCLAGPSKLSGQKRTASVLPLFFLDHPENRHCRSFFLSRITQKPFRIFWPERFFS